jgi:hypothetical protein
MSQPDSLTEIKAALAEITKWPWRGAPGNFIVGDCLTDNPETGRIVAEVPCQGGNPHDFEFIIRAPQRVSALVQRVEELELELGSIELPDDWESEGD